MRLRSFKLLLALVFAAAVATTSPTFAEPHAMPSKQLQLKPGDIITQQQKSGAWSVVKILLIDTWPDGTSTAHCLTYKEAHNKPELGALDKLGVRIWHAPILASSFNSGWDLIGNQATTREELRGFAEYLKHTDFPRYVQFSGQDSKEIVHKANEHYQRALQLGDQQKRLEAIAEYSRAVDLFPLFYEAIDNRAFTYVELGKYREALADFELSLGVNPDGVAAFFSRGECLMRLGQLDAAEAIFKEGVARFPQQKADFSKYLELVRKLKSEG
jgi:tetratricopeptide (TPR) repeat protein